ncbi:MAG: tetratricopeptide repeat protein [Thermodesulfobacteriota bacterium]
MRELWRRLSRLWVRRAFCLSLSSLVVVFFICGCTGPDYLLGTDYRQAEILYGHGAIPQARSKAMDVGEQDPDYERARKLLKDINDLALILSREHMELAEAYEKAGILRKAIHEYDIALRINPSNKWVEKKLTLLGKIYAGETPGEPLPRLEEVRKKISKAKKKEAGPEKKAERHYVKGKLYFVSGKYNKAIKHFTAALKTVPDYKDAEVFLNLARLERQGFIDFHINKGVTLFQKEELELAIKEWNRVLAVDPGNTEAAEYKKRAEAIEMKVKKIQDNQGVMKTPLRKEANGSDNPLPLPLR